MASEDKYRSRERRAAIRNILREQWDPIGVGDAPGAEDEYDSYVGQVYLMLFENKDGRVSASDIADHLLNIALDRMGLSSWIGLTDCCRDAAAALIDLRQRMETQ